jgi:hypothetical protein
MKKAVLPGIIGLVLVVSLLLPGCDKVGTSGEVVTENKDFTGFTSLDIGSAFDVDISRSDTYSVTISADESLFDYIDVTQTGTELKIYLSPRHIFTDFTLGKRVLKAEITMPSLVSLEISGASKGKVTGFNSSSSMDLTVSGATTLSLVSIGTGSLRGEVSGASKVSGNLTASNADFVVSGASTLELSGSSASIILEVSGASRADLEEFQVDDADASVSGASEATVFVEQDLDVEVSGASRFYFVGNPVLGRTNVSGASTIKHKD